MFVTLFNFLIKLIGCGSAALRNILVKIDMKGCWIDHHSILVSTKTFAKICLLKIFFFFFTENSWYSSLKFTPFKHILLYVSTINHRQPERVIIHTPSSTLKPEMDKSMVQIPLPWCWYKRTYKSAKPNDCYLKNHL